MLWRVSSRPIRTRSNPPGFVQPCQPALADRPPSGPGWACGLGLEGIVSERSTAMNSVFAADRALPQFGAAMRKCQADPHGALVVDR
jgi:hypothetical protein